MADIGLDTGPAAVYPGGRPVGGCRVRAGLRHRTSPGRNSSGVGRAEQALPPGPGRTLQRLQRRVPRAGESAQQHRSVHTE